MREDALREARRRIAALKKTSVESGVNGLTAAARDAVDQLDALLAQQLAPGVVMSLREEGRIVSWRQALVAASRDCAPPVRTAIDRALAPLRWPFLIDDDRSRFAEAHD